jgi:hypothetical protein
MNSEDRLREKLRKIEALYAGVTHTEYVEELRRLR